MEQRLNARPEMMQIRRQTVEHVFGTLKAWMGSTHFLTRTLNKVAAEMNLHVLAYNLKRVITIIGIRPLMTPITATKGSPRPTVCALGRCTPPLALHAPRLPR